MFVLALGYSRKSIQLLTFTSSTCRWAELHGKSFCHLGGSVRARQSLRRRPHRRHLRPRPEPALSRCPRLLRRRRAALSCRRSRSQRHSGVGHRPHADCAQAPALRDTRGGAGLSRSPGRALGRHCLHGTTKRQVAAMFAEEQPSLRRPQICLGRERPCGLASEDGRRKSMALGSARAIQGVSMAAC